MKCFYWNRTKNTNLIGTTREKLTFFDIVGNIFMGSNTDAGLGDADYSVYIKASASENARSLDFYKLLKQMPCMLFQNWANIREQK